MIKKYIVTETRERHIVESISASYFQLTDLMAADKCSEEISIISST